ncbi:MAG: carboxypeptidase-like regulatory domain-containing protein, partial [Acidimicrobiia bacterium]|nr:carboxypeptidase-like regulatory domain-containing protein [Acidimicrobiia bacterium]
LGRPMQGAEVRLYLAVQFPNTPLRRIVTGSDGRYRFDDLSAPEQYVVEFASTPDSPGEASAQVDRAAGQQTPDVNHQFAGR